MRKLGLIGILCLVPLVSGCLAVAGLTVGAGVVGYIYYDKNEAWRDFGASFDKTWNATQAALRELKYDVPKGPSLSPDSGYITIDDVKVKVVHHPDDRTRVSVRVGTFHTENHRRRAGQILDKIDEKL
jgi:hypothetical protein